MYFQKNYSKQPVSNFEFEMFMNTFFVWNLKKKFKSIFNTLKQWWYEYFSLDSDEKHIAMESFRVKIHRKITGLS